MHGNPFRQYVHCSNALHTCPIQNVEVESTCVLMRRKRLIISEGESDSFENEHAEHADMAASCALAGPQLSRWVE